MVTKVPGGVGQAAQARQRSVSNRQAQAGLPCENHLAIVPGATDLFEEPGTLDTAAALARDWFLGHLTHGRKPR